MNFDWSHSHECEICGAAYPCDNKKCPHLNVFAEDEMEVCPACIAKLKEAFREH